MPILITNEGGIMTFDDEKSVGGTHKVALELCIEGDVLEKIAYDELKALGAADLSIIDRKSERAIFKF
jgi:hypothetical protein